MLSLLTKTHFERLPFSFISHRLWGAALLGAGQTQITETCIQLALEEAWYRADAGSEALKGCISFVPVVTPRFHSRVSTASVVEWWLGGLCEVSVAVCP